MIDLLRILTPAACVLAAMLGASLARADTVPEPGTPTVCPMIYMPVCGTDGAETKVFANSCVAKSSGFEVVEANQCSADRSIQDCDAGDRSCGKRPLGLGKTKRS